MRRKVGMPGLAAGTLRFTRFFRQTAVLWAICVTTSWGADADGRPSALADLSLEDLGKIEVTSVSKYAQSLREAASSIYVISGDDIRRYGAATLAEALRLAPNLQVARSGSGDYAITARGFNGTIANKLLVLIDGRSVYTPLFSGVFWDVQDVLMEDIERIEVISGPGATLWGANAVNGVINVITRKAADSKGTLATAHAGNEEKGGGFRYGSALSDSASYRIYGKIAEHDSTAAYPSGDAQDAWHLAQTGFRIDSSGKKANATFQGDFYRGASEQPALDNRELQGGNLLTRWSRDLEGNGNVQIQAYYDYTKRVYPGVFSDQLDTLDMEVQHRFRPAERHEILWGAGSRDLDDRVKNSATLAFLPPHRELGNRNIFAQDQISLLPEKLDLTLGSKFEHNDYSGLDIQPSARLSWRYSLDSQIWTAVSRAARAPSRIDTDFYATGSTPIPFTLAGGPDFQSEKVVTYETGYRSQMSPRATLSATAFYNHYKDLRNLELAPTGAYVITNRMFGNTYGIEAWGELRPLDWWQVQWGYTALHENLRLPSDTTDPVGIPAAGNDPAYQFFLRSSADLPNGTEGSMTLRRVGALPSPSIPAYTELDLRMAWRPSRKMELALVGKNLLHDKHLEFGQPPMLNEIERSIFLKATWES